MTTLSEFRKYYKTISNSELLNILQNSKDYQSLALEAAKMELSDRKLSDTEIKEAKEQLIALKQEKERSKGNAKAIESRIRQSGNTILETLNPIQSGIPSTEKTSRFIVIIFGCSFLYQFLKDFRIHLGIVKDISRFPAESIFYLFPLLLLPVAVITFWRKMSIGWIFLMAFLTFTSTTIFLTMFEAFPWSNDGYAGFESIFPRPSPVSYIIQLAFFILIMVVLCKANMRKVYSISEKLIAPTIWVTIILTSLLLLTL